MLINLSSAPLANIKGLIFGLKPEYYTKEIITFKRSLSSKTSSCVTSSCDIRNNSQHSQYLWYQIEPTLPPPTESVQLSTHSFNAFEENISLSFLCYNH